MCEALLLDPVGEVLVVVGEKAVAHERSFKLPAQNLDHDIVAARLVDDVDGDVLAGEDPEPGGEDADAPAGLVDVGGATLSDKGDEVFVDGAETGGDSFARLAEGARRYVYSGRGAEMLGDLRVGDAEAVVQVGGGSPGAWADRDPGRAGGGRGLIGVARADALFASRAPTAFGDKARMHGLRQGQVGLEMLVRVLVRDRAAAVRATVERHMDRFGFLLGRSLAALEWALSGFAARFFACAAGLVAGEGRCLALAPAKFLAQGADLVAKFLDLALKPAAVRALVALAHANIIGRIAGEAVPRAEKSC